MAHVVVMPKLGNTVESCIIVKWNVSEGQAVKADSILCEIETDKATMDLPAGAEGLLLKRLRNEGDDVPVLEPIALIGAAGEKTEMPQAAGQAAAPTGQPAPAASAAPSAPAASKTTGASASSAKVPDVPIAIGYANGVNEGSGATGATAFVSPRAKAFAREKGIPLGAVASGSGPGGRIIERDVRAALAEAPGLTAAARALAAEQGSRDFGKAGGTGLGGRVTLADLAAPRGGAAGPAGTAAFGQAPAKAPVAAGEAFPGPFTDTPIRSIRKIIADRMMHSLQASAQLTLNASAPAERLLSLRNRLKKSNPVLGLSGVTIGDLVAFSASRVLLKYPKLNAQVVDGAVRSFAQVHLGLAVDTPRGLMVPVVRNASALSLREFSEESKRLAKSCVEGSANPDFLSGSTFTVTNLGAFGIESFTPILNEPETGILGVDAITPRPTIDPDGKPGVEMRIGFSLTVDHRVVDGADAARFLKDLAGYIADIDIILLVDLM